MKVPILYTAEEEAWLLAIQLWRKEKAEGKNPGIKPRPPKRNT